MKCPYCKSPAKRVAGIYDPDVKRANLYWYHCGLELASGEYACGREFLVYLWENYPMAKTPEGFFPHPEVPDM